LVGGRTFANPAAMRAREAQAAAAGGGQRPGREERLLWRRENPRVGGLGPCGPLALRGEAVKVMPRQAPRESRLSGPQGNFLTQ
jgi:hypothetical protein